MSAVEEIEAAIVTLTELKEFGSPAPWTAWKQRRGNYLMTHGLEDCRGEQLAIGMTSPDARLAEALHRTIDAQLAILTIAAKFAAITPNAFTNAGVDLARAINGTA